MITLMTACVIRVITIRLFDVAPASAGVNYILKTELRIHQGDGTMKGSEKRKADHPIANIFLNRWSPRAMTGEPIAQEDLMVLFEAARWAPSSYNYQPWRFLYARRDSEHWQTFFDLMVEFN